MGPRVLEPVNPGSTETGSIFGAPFRSADQAHLLTGNGAGLELFRFVVPATASARARLSPRLPRSPVPSGASHPAYPAEKRAPGTARSGRPQARRCVDEMPGRARITTPGACGVDSEEAAWARTSSQS
jgi:hypothetical protein